MYAAQPAGNRPYGLGDIFDTIASIAEKVATGAAKVDVVAQQAGQVAQGKKKVALIPTQGASFTLPVSGQMFGVTVPVMPLLIGAGVLAFFALRRKRR